jgi:hypothetical protein
MFPSRAAPCLVGHVHAYVPAPYATLICSSDALHKDAFPSPFSLTNRLHICMINLVLLVIAFAKAAAMLFP